MYKQKAPAEEPVANYPENLSYRLGVIHVRRIQT